MRTLKRNLPTIGVLAGWQVYSGTIHSFLDNVLRGTQSAANRYGFNLLIGCGVNTPAYPDMSYTALPIVHPHAQFVPIGPWNTDGIIVAPPMFLEDGPEYFEKLIDEGFPVVFAGDRDIAPSVCVDNEGGILQAITHLVEHGHRDIAFIAGYHYPHGDSSARLKGYINGLKQNGLPYDPDLVTYGEHTPSDSYQAMMEIIQRGKPFTGVVTSNDDTAIGAMDALRDAGLSVPQDVAVIGFDDRFEARAQIPLLTTVHHPMFELGYQAAELLYNIIEGRAAQNSLIRIPTHLIVRESCGCLPGANSGYSIPDLRTTPLSPLPLPDEYTRPKAGDGIALTETSHAVQANLTLKMPEPLNDHRRHMQITQLMADGIYKEMQRLSRNEVEYLCVRLLDSFKLSLTHGSAITFRQAIQQILEHVAKAGDDLYAWQNAITVLNDYAPGLLASLPYTLPQGQVDHMLHQARIAISEISRGQYARRLVDQTYITNQIGQMTSRFFEAVSEAEIYDIFAQYLPALNIQSAAVAIYEPLTAMEDELYTWSRLKMHRQAVTCPERFITREFPPEGLYPADRPFQIALLPLSMSEGVFGFMAVSTPELEPLGSIVRQLVAALRSAQLYQEAVEARRLAEDARQGAEDARQGAEEARQSAEEARQMAEDARKMAEEARQSAEEANYLKSRFLSIVSHELRTPLNLIYGLSNMMLEQAKEVSEQECLVNRKDLERIDIGAQHLESLIRDVLDLARSDLGQLNLVCEPLDLNEVIHAVATIGEQLARDKDLRFQVEAAPQLPKVRGDRTRLRQVVLNLVNNAVKFTEQGSVLLSAKAVNGGVRIAVSDTGLGIPPDEQRLIFDEFRQSRRTTARGFGGLGLGLAICKRLVEMHEGEIGVTSSGKEGEGSTFYIQLPALAAKEPCTASTCPEKHCEHVLLMVKDLPGSERLNHHLSQQGFQVEVHAVETGCEWMQWLQPTPPDKVVMDLGLITELGWEILKILKGNPATRDIPVLFYQLENEQDTGSLLDLNFLTKPISTTDLAEELLARGFADGKHDRSLKHAILVVDDDPGILELHTRILERLTTGYRIIQAKNGVEALAIVHKERPVLVLLDLIMPEMDGFTVLEQMQADETTRSIPVIVLTSQVLTEEDMLRLNSGVASVLSKGMYNTQETLEHVSAALSRKRKPGTETQRLVLKAMAYIHAHYKDPISRSEVAAHVGVSERHLARCFQQEIGLTPIIYMTRFRVNMAKALLSAGKMSITDVALEVGFSAGGYFTRVFRDEVGLSPREFVRKNGNQ